MFRLIKKIKDNGRWRIFKLKLIDARLYFVSIFVGLLTGLVAVPYHYLLQFFFNLRHDFFDSHPKWYWYIPLFLLMWGILVFVSWLVKKMPLITGGGIPQTRGVINGRVDYKHPFLELVAKFVGGILASDIWYQNGGGCLVANGNNYCLPVQVPDWRLLLLPH